MALNPETAPVFSGAATQFAAYGENIAGVVRYALTQQNMAQWVDGVPPMRVLEVGGGAGIDALHLANLGHDVTIIEPEIEQFNRAETMRAEQPQTIQRRIHVKQKSLEDLPSDGEYDFVVCHCVAQYQKNPAQFLGRVLAQAKPGGYASILEKNYLGAEQRLREKRDQVGITRLRKSQRFINNVDKDVYAFMGAELDEIIINAGGTILQHRGVRSTSDTDRRPVSSVPASDVQKILSDEAMRGTEASLLSMSQLHHVIAQINPR